MFEKQFTALIDKIVGERTLHRIREDLKTRFLRNNDCASFKLDREQSIKNIHLYYKKAKENQNKIEEIAFIIDLIVVVIKVSTGLLNIVLYPLLSLIFDLFALCAILLTVNVILRKILIEKNGLQIS